MWLCSLLAFALAAPPSRVSSIRKDLSRAEVIYMSEGLVSVVEFPAPILEIRNGNQSSIKAMISSVSPKELTLILHQSQATNLLVRAGKRMYVFDIVPSKSTHQDYVKVTGAFSAPAYETKSNPIETVELSPKSKTHQGSVIESGVIR